MWRYACADDRRWVLGRRQGAGPRTHRSPEVKCEMMMHGTWRCTCMLGPFVVGKGRGGVWVQGRNPRPRWDVMTENRGAVSAAPEVEVHVEKGLAQTAHLAPVTAVALQAELCACEDVGARAWTTSDLWPPVCDVVLVNMG